MTIQPFYVSKDCLGEGSVKVFLASDIENLILERIAVYRQEQSKTEVQSLYRRWKHCIEGLESLLAVLNPSNEKETSDEA